MKPRDVAELLLLAAIWGASFLFMRLAVAAFGPVVLADVRVTVAGLLLLPVAWAGGHVPAMRRHWRPLLIAGVASSALPFVAFSYAALQLGAGIMSVLNATTPLFAALDRGGVEYVKIKVGDHSFDPAASPPPAQAELPWAAEGRAA